MLDFWALVVLAVLWVLVAPLIGLVMARGARQRATEAIQRVAALEAQFSYAPSPQPARAEAAPRSAPIERSAGPWGEGSAVTEPPEPAALDTSPERLDPPVDGSPEQVPSDTPEARPVETLEGKIGGRWSVLVGGLALALGAIFLVRFSIEQGLLGPGARIVLGFALSAVLFAGGEVLRRRDRATSAPVVARADVPAILTGAAGIAAFATIYAAYALYGFIGDAAAFVLLTVAGLVTLFLSVIHGPALAALGALGSYGAPLLVSSDVPKPFPVVLHVVTVTAAVLAMARIRGWRWLAVAGIAASLTWGVLVGLIGNVNTTAAELLLIAALTAVYVSALIAGVEPATLRDRRQDRIGLGALAGVAALSVFYGLVNDVYPALLAGIVLAGALGAIASRWTAVAGAACIAAALAVATIMLLDPPGASDLDTIRVGALEWFILGDANLRSFALRSAAIASVVGIGALLSADRAGASAPRTAGLFAAAGAATPLLVLVLVYLRHTPFETRPGVGLAALALGALFAVVTERLIARRPADDSAPAPAYYAAGSVLALAFASAVGLQSQFIPLALSLGAAGVAWVALARPVKVLPWLAVLAAALACAALIAGPPLTPQALGETPILNGLILRFGLPALAVLGAGEMLRRHQNGLPAGLLQAIGLALAALFVVLEIRHFANDGVLTTGVPGLGEQSALTMAALAFSLGLQRIAARTASPIYRAGSLVAGLAGAAVIVVAHFGAANPVITGEDVGDGAVFNLLLPGYLLPAILAALVAAEARAVRPRWYVLVFAALSLALGFAYVTLMVRHAFHGGDLGRWSVLDAENWTYSAVWLLFGIGLLAAGIALRSAPVRAASGLVIAAVVLKVFLLDMAALTGALRAASFLGLGIVLIVIGRLYQRLLARAAGSRARSG